MYCWADRVQRPDFVGTPSGATECVLSVQEGAGALSVTALAVLTKLIIGTLSSQLYMHFTPTTPFFVALGTELDFKSIPPLM